MARPQFQDIIPPDRKSIKKIPLPERRRERLAPAEPVYDEPRFEREPEQVRTRPRRRLISLRTVLILFIVAGLGAGAFYLTSRVSGAKVVITPREQPISVDSQFVAVKEGSNQDGDLPYQTVTISKDGKMNVEASGEEQANTKASGTIVIYNNYSAVPQELVANTRFETKEGLIFRIGQAVTIPGKNGSTPGSIEAIITADKPGPQYNVGLKDFTIPGFKGTAKYAQIYARSKVPVQGGFTGLRKKVDEEKVKTVRAQIREELKANLVGQARNDIPAGFLLLNNAYYIEYESMPNTESGTGGAQINERATFHGLIFKHEDLSKNLNIKANGASAEPANLASTADLTFSTRAGTSSSPWNAEKFTFTVKGATSLIAAIDIEKLKTELAGKPKKSLNTVLSGYPNIVKAEVTMRPFWKTIFPVNKEEIAINVNQGQISP